jgi:ribulose-phosphate 3-epimerase
MTNKIIPTILVKNKEELMERRTELKKHFSLAQLDVADGKFVPNRSLPLDNIKRSTLKYEVHLMVKDNLVNIKKALKLHPVSISFHYESCRDEKEIEALINFLKRRKIKPGIALHPKTQILKVKPFLKKVDRIMILGVAPGFSGQKFLPSTINKVKALRKMDRKIIIEVDGGVSDKNIVKLKKAGANLFCLGSYLSGEEMPENLKLLKKMIK